MKKDKLIVLIIIAIVAIPIALFIGKTRIVDNSITIERPFTAILFYLAVIAACIES